MPKKDVKDFLQSKGVKDQNGDRTNLAKQLLGGLLLDIFGPVIEAGKLPQSGYPCHDGTLTDNTRDISVVVYEHEQAWYHYHTDPVKDGLGGCRFNVKITGPVLDLPSNAVSIDLLIDLMLGDKLKDVLDANPKMRAKKDNEPDLKMFEYSNHNDRKTVLGMHVMDPRYESVSQACELYKKIVDVIKATRPLLAKYAGLISQENVVPDLRNTLNLALTQYNQAFAGVPVDSVAYRLKLKEVIKFVSDNQDAISRTTTGEKARVLNEIKEMFAPIRQEIATYFSQPLYSTAKR